MSSRSLLIRWGYVASQIMRNPVSPLLFVGRLKADSTVRLDNPQWSCIWNVPNLEAVYRVGHFLVYFHSRTNSIPT